MSELGYISPQIRLENLI